MHWIELYPAVGHWLAVTIGKSDRWGTDAIARILKALPEIKWTWQQAAAAGKEVEDTYWSQRHVFFINSSTADLVFAIEKLIEAHRAKHAIELVGHSL